LTNHRLEPAFTDVSLSRPNKGKIVRQLLKWIAGAAVLFAASGTQAAWYAAKSRHFVIYADDNPKNLEAFATKLERFDQAARVAMHTDDPEVGNGNRLTVFVLPKASDVRAIVGDKTGFFEGYYTGRVNGSLAYIPKDALKSSDDNSDAILFHEYTHHLMMQDLKRPYPEWYVEGFAEFLSTPKFGRDGSVTLGRAVQGRAWGLFNGPKMPVQTLFGGLQPDMTNEQRDVFYGRGWLLTHYLTMDPHRAGQMVRFVEGLTHGEAQADAARQAFGDLDQLDKDLDAYRRKPLLQFTIAGSNIHVGQIDVTPLSAGAAEVITARAQVKYGTKGQASEGLAAQVRAVESRFPGDEIVESTLAEAELDAGHAQAAEAAADRALKADSRNVEATVEKARAIMERAKDVDGADRHNLFEQARALLIAANKIDTEDPEPLYEYYWAFLKEGRRPTENAIAALHYASDLAPQDLGVRMSSAFAYLEEGKLKDARSTLTVVAYSPHAADVGQMAQRMIRDIDAGDGKAALDEMRASSAKKSGS
jgi:tetratricopeptide (TPR) repeat protein